MNRLFKRLLLCLLVVLLLCCVLTLVACDDEKDSASAEDESTDTGDSGSKGLAFEESEDGNSYIVSELGECSDKAIVIPSTHNGKPVSGIGARAFYNCMSLTSITVPASVTSIGEEAFYGCERLIEVYNLSSHITVKAGSVENGYIGCYAKDVYTTAKAKSKLFVNENGYQFYDNGTNRYLIDYLGTDTALVLPANCNGKNYGIYQYAFYRQTQLPNVTIPAGVTCIGDFAFFGCTKLQSVAIAESVYMIGSYAFSDCTNLANIAIPASVTNIDFYAFKGCTNLTAVVFAVTSDWFCSSQISSGLPPVHTKLSSSDLTDATTAATYLTSTYVNRYWQQPIN